MSKAGDSGSDSEGDYYGPALPPHLQRKGNDADSKTDDSSTKAEEQTSSSTSRGREEGIGPRLPPGFKLPDLDNDSPAGYLPVGGVDSGSEEESDDDVIGPLPPDHPLAIARAASFQSSSKKGPEEGEKKLQREEWMLIPPKNKPVTELGLGPRKFLTRAPEAPVKDDGEPMDSDEEFERLTREEMDKKIIEDYDKTMEAMIDKAGGEKRKKESLLEIHQKEMKKAKKNEPEESKRKPFDRNTDLAVSGLTREDSKKYIEKTRELGGRFHKGRQKFL